MPPLEVIDLYQTALLWPYLGNDAEGQPVVGPPQQIRCRWNTVRREVRSPDGSTVALASTAVVAQEVAIGSRLWLGTLNQWNGTGSSPVVQDEELMVVFSFNESLDLKGRVARRTLEMMRFRARQ